MDWTLNPPNEEWEDFYINLIERDHETVILPPAKKLTKDSSKGDGISNRGKVKEEERGRGREERY